MGGATRALSGWAFAAVLVAACGAHDAAAERRSNVVLITIDTLRADHVSCYGYSKPTTPALDAFAKRATQYTDCLAPAPWTVPSHASLFTGLFPTEHGAHTLKSPGNEAKFEVCALADEHTTLAEAFAQEGYATAGFAANAMFLSRRLKFDQGFGTYVAARATADKITNAALAWLDEAHPQPFFLFLNYMDAHCPYNPAARAQAPLPRPDARNSRTLMDRLVNTLAQTDEPVPQPFVDALVGQYDNGIAFADEQIGRLLSELERRGLYDSTFIVIASDHGEFFGEHRLAEHSRDVYQPVLWVPLLVKQPGQRNGAIVREPFDLVDVPNLIFSTLAGSLSRDWTRQFSRAPGNHPRLAESHYTRRADAASTALAARFDRVRRALYDGSFKYIASSDGNDELYDLAQNPTEQSNLLAQRPELCARFVDALRHFDEAAAMRAPAARTPAPETIDTSALQELGYH
jgi:arylsulfatase A-like enzyme